jgi:hypothetical protein
MQGNRLTLQKIVEAARIKPAVVEVEAHPYVPEWDLLEYCQRHGIVLLAFAALGHAMKPRLLDDPVIIAIAQRIRKTPAQVLLARAVQRGTAFLTTSVTPARIQENFELSALPEDAMREIRDGVATKIRFGECGEYLTPGRKPVACCSGRRSGRTRSRVDHLGRFGDCGGHAPLYLYIVEVAQENLPIGAPIFPETRRI